MNFKFIVSLSLVEGYWTLTIEDNGNGFSEDDIERIMKDTEYVRKSIKDPKADFC